MYLERYERSTPEYLYDFKLDSCKGVKYKYPSGLVEVMAAVIKAPEIP